VEVTTKDGEITGGVTKLSSGPPNSDWAVDTLDFMLRDREIDSGEKK